MRAYKFAVLCGVLLLGVAAGGCSKLKARDQLNKGVAAFRNAQFQQAIMHFKNAVDLDPTLLNARLYLATAHRQLYIPGGDSPENVKVGQQAIQVFEEVLKMDPVNTSAIASIAQTYYDMREFDKAKEYQRRYLQISPNERDPYYWIGVIDWATVYPKRMQVRKDLNIAFPPDPNQPGVLPPLPPKARAELAEQNSALVEEGIQALTKAVQLKPNDADAMAYINLMYRERADLQADVAAREQDLKTADEWVEKALNIKKGATAATPSAFE